MFKIALNAGHGINTPGKRCLKALDPNETREWVLNSRICNKVVEGLKRYDGYELIRIDDTTGKNDLSITERANKANNFGADIYIAVHHNAGLNGGNGGGIMAFVYLKVDEYTKKMQRLLYTRLIEKTGLKGNRANPIGSADFGECRQTKMPAVLLECGFMDSIDDVPVILSEDFASKCAEAIVESIVSLGNLKEKQNQETQQPAEDNGGLYRVQVGAYQKFENALAMQQRLKALGYSAIIKTD